MRSAWPLWATLFVVVAALSLRMDVNYDEGVWITVGRKFLAGDSLYSEVYDHKSPPVLAVAGLLDLLPGSFQFVRAFFVGLLAALIGRAAAGFAMRSGVQARAAGLLGFVVGALAAVQSFFALTVEMLGVAFVIAALALVARGWARWAGFLAVVAVVVEPRLVFALPAVMLVARRTGGPTASRGYLGTAAIFASLVGLTLVLSADVRFWLLEMPLRSRLEFQPVPSARSLTAARSTLSAFVIVVGLSGGVALRGRRPNLSGAILLVGTLGMVLLSRYGFPRYWALLLPGVVLATSEMSVDEASKKSNDVGLIAAFAALLPWFFVTAALLALQTGSSPRDHDAAEHLSRTLRDEQTFVAFLDRTQLPALLPLSYGLPTPALVHFGFESSRQNDMLVEVGRRIDNAEAVVLDPSVGEHPHLGVVWRIFEERMLQFPCVIIQGYEVRYRAESCPVGTSYDPAGLVPLAGASTRAVAIGTSGFGRSRPGR